ncbi:MAG: Gfo/Idh/MocA family protein [Candidatus Methylomirabilaceae bacterium]
MSVRYGIVGAGKAGILHAPAVLENRRATLIWIADTDAPRGEALAARCSARYLPDYREGLAGVDAVSICLPHALLADAAVTAARAGVHVLAEKPMALTLGDTDRVIVAARSAGISLMVGFVHRFRPESRRAVEMIASGDIGEPRFVTDRSSGGGLAGWPGWVQDAAAGGGLLLYSGVHRIDRARWLLGRDVSSVYGSTAALLPGRDVDSSYTVALTFDGGARAVLSSHYHAVEAPHRWETEIHGTEGMIRIHTGESLDLVTRDGSRHEAAGADRRFNEEIEAFLDAIDGTGPASPSGTDAREVLAVAIAVAHSHATGRTVALAESPAT